MLALNIREKDIQGQMESVSNFHRNSLENVMDSNIDDGVAGKKNLL